MHAKDKRRKPAIERFFDRISPEPNSGCWLWSGACLTNGYGTFSPTQSRHGKGYAHRFSYETFVGQIDDGMVIDHLCRVRCCVNPDHLEAVTRGENVRRGDAPAHIARRAGTCTRGHALVDENAMGKQRPRCRQCYAEWKEARITRAIVNRMIERVKAPAALNLSELKSGKVM